MPEGRLARTRAAYPEMEMRLFITDGPSDFGWYDPSLQCWCHVVDVDGVRRRYIGPSAAGPWRDRQEPFPDEPPVPHIFPRITSTTLTRMYDHDVFSDNPYQDPKA